MRILVTNDDGIDSVGLHVLARAMTAYGDVVIVAPNAEYSGAGASLGALHLIQPEVRRETVAGVDEAWSVTGPPALCVFFARLGTFGGAFDLIVSGINPGANVGRAVYHSGTVGAVLTGRSGAISGIAVSQAVAGLGVEGQAWDEMIVGQHWETAAAVAGAFAEGLLRELPADPVVVNLNVPNVPLGEVRGWKHATVGQHPPRLMSRAVLEPKSGYEGAFSVKMTWGDSAELPVGSDGRTVADGFVAVTYLSRLEHTDRTDVDAGEAGLSELMAS